MTDILIRDVPDDVLAVIDAKARRVGLSRRIHSARLVPERDDAPPEVSVEDLVAFATGLLILPTLVHETGLVLTTWLIDKSALVRLGRSPNAGEWANRVERGLVRICTVTRLEVGFSARSVDDLRAGYGSPPLARMPIQHLTPAIEDRAVEVQVALAERASTGRHLCQTYSLPPLPSWPAHRPAR